MKHELRITPGSGWRWTRRATQAGVLLILVLSPLLGGWQRQDRAAMATWLEGGSDLAPALQVLPPGEAVFRVHDINRLRGGGLAFEVLGIPGADPLPGIFALLEGGLTVRAVVAVAIPVVLSLIAGRVFCGWLCPFGFLARCLGRVLERVGWRAFRIPDRRPLRWLVLVGSVAVGLVGTNILLYLALPHLLLQHSVHRAWLLGGGGTILGVLSGLIAALVLFGPTSYCVTLCPTGAALSGLGRRRLLRLQIQNPEGCGRSCQLCDRACWLQLHPALGDPGPDCDLCARCVGSCPRSNLRVGIGRGQLKKAALSVALAVLVAHPARATFDPDKPRLMLHQEQVVDGVTVALAVVDLSAVRLDADDLRAEGGTEVSFFLARGERGVADERGRLPARETSEDSLTIRVERVSGGPGLVRTLSEPDRPRSTPRRSIYRARFEETLDPGDRVVLEAVPGWLGEELSWTVPGPARFAGTTSPGIAFLVSALFFSGLLSLALADPFTFFLVGTSKKRLGPQSSRIKEMS